MRSRLQVNVDGWLVRQLKGAVIIAVIAIGMMKVTAHQIVDMVAMWHCLVAAVRTVLVFRAVRTTVMALGAIGRVRGIDVQCVLVDMIIVERVQMAIV
jgi:hypothetical protein